MFTQRPSWFLCKKETDKAVEEVEEKEQETKDDEETVEENAEEECEQPEVAEERDEEQKDQEDQAPAVVQDEESLDAPTTAPPPTSPDLPLEV